MQEHAFPDDFDDDFHDARLWELEVEFDGSLRAEQESAAKSMLAHGRNSETFLERLRLVASGDLITIALVDGSSLHGRVVGVGEDFLTLAESQETLGTARARSTRFHEVRLAAVARLIRGGPQ